MKYTSLYLKVGCKALGLAMAILAAWFALTWGQARADHTQILMINRPGVDRVLVLPLDRAKRWPAPAREIQRALAQRPAALSKWTALGEELRGAPRAKMAKRIKAELAALPYTVDSPQDEWIGPITLAERGFRGDCEDYGALGLYALAVAGVPELEAAALLGFDRRGRAHVIVVLKDDAAAPWLHMDFADPNVEHYSKSGFQLRAIGFVNHIGFDMTKRRE